MTEAEILKVYDDKLDVIMNCYMDGKLDTIEYQIEMESLNLWKDQMMISAEQEPNGIILDLH